MSEERRAALVAAMAEHAEPEAEAPPVEAAPVVEAPAVEPEAPAVAAPLDGRDEKGRFAAKAKAESQGLPNGAVQTAENGKPAEPLAAPPPAPATPPPEALRPPQSWKATAREEWGKLPPAVQSEVQRRETETAVKIKQGGDALAFQETFQRTLQPFEGLLRNQGVHPLQAIGGMLQTAQALESPQHRDAAIAHLIRSYGGDPERIGALLQQPGAQPQHQQADPRAIAAQVRAELQQEWQQREQQQETQRWQQQIDAFMPTAEFFSDVEGDMADLIRLAHGRGLKLSLQDAYNRAVSMLPDDSEPKRVLKQREAAKVANASQASTLRAKAASSSVKNQPASVSNGKQEPHDRKAAIRAAMAAHSRDE